MEPVRIGEGKNGEVWPCPECENHETVEWLKGNDYMYYCDKCDVTFGERKGEYKNE